MNAQERKDQARENRRQQKNERRVAAQKSKKDTASKAEYKSASEQLGTSGLTGSLRYRTRDKIHEQELLQRKEVLKADDAVFDTYFTINAPGTVFIWDKDMGKVVFGVRCIPLTDNSEVAEFDKFFHHVHHDSKLHPQIKTNSAQAIGAMGAMGWRAGYKAGVAFDTYSYLSNGKKKDEWDKLREQDYNIHSFYGCQFCRLAPAFFAMTQQWSSRLSTPLWGQQFVLNQSTITDMNDYCFASNLTYTKMGSNGRTFSNRPHKDNDGSYATFGIWGLVDGNGAWVKNKLGMMKGGFFYVAPYCVKIDFAARTDCVWELVWRGKDDVHATVDGEMNEGYQWLGSLAQTGHSLIQRVQAWTQAQV